MVKGIPFLSTCNSGNSKAFGFSTCGVPLTKIKLALAQSLKYKPRKQPPVDWDFNLYFHWLVTLWVFIIFTDCWCLRSHLRHYGIIMQKSYNLPKEICVGTYRLCSSKSKLGGLLVKGFLFASVFMFYAQKKAKLILECATQLNKQRQRSATLHPPNHKSWHRKLFLLWECKRREKSEKKLIGEILRTVTKYMQFFLKK